MKPEWERKWDANLSYSERNYEEFQKLYGGKNIVILNEQILFATTDNNEWWRLWNFLTSTEKSEAYHRYIPREDEVLVF